MADTIGREYKIQVISSRYIKNKVLEYYVNGKVGEFGADWRLSRSRDNKISFTALRELSEAELDRLHQESCDADPQPLFIDDAISDACRVAQDEVADAQIEQGSKSFFSFEKLRNFFTRQKVREVLLCDCSRCRQDLQVIPGYISRETYIDIIMGTSEPQSLRRTYYSVFGLLVYTGHPMFIIGFLDQNYNDHTLEQWATYQSDFSNDRLESLTGKYSKRNSLAFSRFVRKFTTNLPAFAIPRLEPDKFLKYRNNAIMPFIEEVQIGQRQVDGGHWTSEGANGKVFAFKIQREYNRFPNSASNTEYARKCIETPEPQAYLELSNITHVQQFGDEHIVKLIKAYGHGESINLIFPRTWTNLDHLLREQKWGYDNMRGAKLESADAWKQILGILSAMKKIHGFGHDQTEKNAEDELCIHFDLKPDNILVERDGNWLISDFGRAALTKHRRGTTPRIGGHFGTDAYAPPEIDDMSIEFGRAYDIWSLGCIMLEVAAFMVYGYAGLNGSGSFSGLDQIRRAMPKWARSSDERFFYQEIPKGEYIVKKEVQDFMVNLESSHARSSDCDDQSKDFLRKIMDLINQMLRPNAKERIRITKAVDLLTRARRETSTSVFKDRSHQPPADADEQVLQEFEMSHVNLYHWSSVNKEWEECSLAILRNKAEYMRLHCWGPGYIPTDVNFPRNRAKILPLYAFWNSTQIQGAKAWINFLAMSDDHCSVIPDARFAFDEESGLDDARLVQSVLTSQKIFGSFPLSRVTMSRPNSFPAALGRVLPKFKPGNDNSSKVHDARLLDQKFATIQFWIEQKDTARTMRGEAQGSRALDEERSARRSHRDRPNIPPCRLVIYLHEPQIICTIRFDVNWKLSKGTFENKLNIKPRPSGGSDTFYASWLRPTPSEHAEKQPAGIPLDPKVLRYHEDSDSIELDDIELTFLTSDDVTDFTFQYNAMKEAWPKERDPAGDNTQVNGKPESTPYIPRGAVPLSLVKTRFLEPRGTARDDAQTSFNTSAIQTGHDSTMDNGVRQMHNPALLIVPPRQVSETDQFISFPERDDADNPDYDQEGATVVDPVSISEKTLVPPMVPEMQEDVSEIDQGVSFPERDIAENPNFEREDTTVVGNLVSISGQTLVPPTVPEMKEDLSGIDRGMSFSGRDVADTRSLVSEDNNEHHKISPETEFETAVVHILATNQFLGPVYEKGLQLMPEERFINNYRRILKAFYEGIVTLPTTAVTHELKALLRYKENRHRIAKRIIEDCQRRTNQQANDKQLDLEHVAVAVEEDDVEEQERLRVERWNMWLDRITKDDHSQHDFDDNDEEMTDEDPTDENPTDEGDFSKQDESPPCTGDESPTTFAPIEHHQVIHALVESQPFQDMLLGLKAFLLPDRLINDILPISSEHINFESPAKSALVNKFQRWMESITGLEWDWWPLSPHMRPLRDDETRVFWQCVCGAVRSRELRIAQKDILEDLLRTHPVRKGLYQDLSGQSLVSLPRLPMCALLKSAQCQRTTYPTQQLSPTSASEVQAPQNSSSQNPSSQNSSSYQAGSAPSASGRQASNNYQSAGPASVQTQHSNNNQYQTQSQKSQTDPRWLLFGVSGNRVTVKLGQVDKHSLTSDPIFLRNLQKQHDKLRGWPRLYLTFWKLSYWDFVRFRRLHGRYLFHRKELPDKPEYKYAPRPPSDPGVDKHGFEQLVRACITPCRFSWWTHDCYCIADNCDEVVGYLPKRDAKFRLDAPTDPRDEIVWGLEAKYVVAAWRVLLIHVLILTFPFTFWGMWQHHFPTDLQGASVPLMGVATLISVFWSSTGILKIMRDESRS